MLSRTALFSGAPRVSIALNMRALQIHLLSAKPYNTRFLFCFILSLPPQLFISLFFALPFLKHFH